MAIFGVLLPPMAFLPSLAASRYKTYYCRTFTTREMDYTGRNLNQSFYISSKYKCLYVCLNRVFTFRL